MCLFDVGHMFLVLNFLCVGSLLHLVGCGAVILCCVCCVVHSVQLVCYFSSLGAFKSVVLPVYFVVLYIGIW